LMTAEMVAVEMAAAEVIADVAVASEVEGEFERLEE